MFEALEGIPSYKYLSTDELSEDTYNKLVGEYKGHVSKAFDLLKLYMTKRNEVVFEMSTKELLKAGEIMGALLDKARPEITDMVSHKASFMYALAGATLGC